MNWLVELAAAILTAAGLLAYLKQYRMGLTATGLHDRFTWGLYIQGFFFFSALASGILVFIATVTLFGLGSLRQLAETGAAVSLSCLAAAGAMLSADLGKPLRVFRIILGNNWSSPMTWDFYMISLCGLLNLIYLTGAVSGGVAATVWAVLCLGAALAFVMVHTLFFLAREGAGFRSQPFLALDTLAQSLWGGLAVIGIVSVALGEVHQVLFRLLLVLSVLTLMPPMGVLIAVAGSNIKGSVSRVMIWLNVVILLLLLVSAGSGTGSPVIMAAAAVLILIAVFLEKAHLVRRYQHSPTLPLPYSLFEEAPEYRPTAVEWMLTAGSAGFCVLLSSAVIYLLDYVR